MLFGYLFVPFVFCLRVIHMPARHHVHMVQGPIRGTFTVLSPAHPLVLVQQGK
jgi:hypothetical protein